MADAHWLGWWGIAVSIQITIGFIGGIWIVSGGLIDLRKMYRRLETVKHDELDDGRVTEDQFPADEDESAVDDLDDALS